MTILDRYIVRRFLLWLGFNMAGFTIVFICVDLTDHLDTFLDKGATASAVAAYYLYFIPYIVVLTLPLSGLLATLFTFGGLARHNEIVAMKASGISLYRILAPVYGAAFLLACGALVFGDVVVPGANQRKMEIRRGEEADQADRDGTDVLLQDVDGQIVFVRRFSAADRTGEQVSIEQYQGASVVQRIIAQKIAWVDGRWVLRRGEVREFEGDRETMTAFDSLTTVRLTLLPSDFVREPKRPENMDYQELQGYIARVARNGGDASRWLVDLHLKIAFPFVGFIIVMLGAPICSTTGRTGRTRSFAASLVIAFLYYSLVKAGQAMGHGGTLSPPVAAWLPNALFAAVAVGMLIGTRK